MASVRSRRLRSNRARPSPPSPVLKRWPTINEPDTHVVSSWRAFSDGGSTPPASTAIFPSQRANYCRDGKNQARGPRGWAPAHSTKPHCLTPDASLLSHIRVEAERNVSESVVSKPAPATGPACHTPGVCRQIAELRVPFNATEPVIWYRVISSRPQYQANEMRNERKTRTRPPLGSMV